MKVNVINIIALAVISLILAFMLAAIGQHGPFMTAILFVELLAIGIASSLIARWIG